MEAAQRLILNTDQIKQIAPSLIAGTQVLLSGVVYTARDAAHKRLLELIDLGLELPFELSGAVIYYAGPTQAPSHLPIGACGPTTSGRMDPYTPTLLNLGLAAMVGKGERSSEVSQSIIANQSVYFCAVGGAGALAARCIRSCKVIAFEDLGCESIKQLYLKDFPVTVAIDCQGGNIFQAGRELFAVI